LIGLFFYRRKERQKLKQSFMENINRGDEDSSEQLITQQPRKRSRLMCPRW